LFAPFSNLSQRREKGRGGPAFFLVFFQTPERGKGKGLEERRALFSIRNGARTKKGKEARASLLSFSGKEEKGGTPSRISSRQRISLTHLDEKGESFFPLFFIG